MQVTYRLATTADHKAIVKLAKTSPYTKDYSNQLMFSSDAAYSKGWIRVAEAGGRIVGFTCIRHKIRVPETILYFIAVDAEYRSLGIGEKLLHEVMLSSPHRTMCLKVMKDNARAIAFYTRLDFEQVGESLEGKGLELKWCRPSGS